MTPPTPNIPSAVVRLKAAIDLHLAQRIDDAMLIYQEVLAEDPNNANALCLFGMAAQDKGQLEQAIGFLRRALEIQPDNPDFLRSLANALRLAREDNEAMALYRRTLAALPDDLESWFNQGKILQANRRHAEAIDCYAQYIQRNAGHVRAHNDMGVAYLALQKYEDASACFARAIAIDPNFSEAYNNLGVVHANLQQPDRAAEFYGSALRCKPDYAMALFNMGTIHFKRKEFDQALQWYQDALRVDPALVEAHQNVASILLDRGELDTARWHRDQAYQRQPIFIDNTEQSFKSVVILWASGKGNVPVDYLFPKACYTRVHCMVEYLRADQLNTLPAYDLVFNAIGDSDVTGATDATVKAFRDRCDKPFLNHPDRINRTGRDDMPTLFADVPDTVCANTLRCATSEFKSRVLATPALQFPLIVRPSGSHGGDHLMKVDTAQQLTDLALFNAPVYYASNYVDYLSADGFFRKYRVVFINRQAFPYHLAIGTHWIVHYETADMLSFQWKLDEELAFLRDPVGVLGARVMRAVESMGRVMDLDYCGVDFSVLPDGRVLVFEANATMLIHGENVGGVLEHKNPYVQTIFDAFNRYVARLTNTTV